MFVWSLRLCYDLILFCWFFTPEVEVFRLPSYHIALVVFMFHLPLFSSEQCRSTVTLRVKTQRFAIISIEDKKMRINNNSPPLTSNDAHRRPATSIRSLRYACGFASFILSSLTILWSVVSFAYRAQTQNTAYRNAACGSTSQFDSVCRRRRIFRAASFAVRS